MCTRAHTFVFYCFKACTRGTENLCVKKILQFPTGCLLSGVPLFLKRHQQLRRLLGQGTLREKCEFVKVRVNKTKRVNFDLLKMSSSKRQAFKKKIFNSLMSCWRNHTNELNPIQTKLVFIILSK